MNSSALLHQAAKKYPAKIAIYDEYGSMTYRELSDLVNETASILRMHGIRKGMGVGVMGRNSRYFIASAFAVMETEAVVMPISSQVSDDELKEIIAVSGLHAICNEPAGLIARSFKKCVPVNLPGEEWKLWFNNNVSAKHIFASHVPDAALVRFTSGTTGTSKGVVLSHTSIEERTSAANGVLKLNEHDVVMWVLSMAYHFVVSVILYLRYGCAIVINNDFMASTVLEEINRFKATFFYGSPMHIRLLAADSSTSTISTIKKVISTSTAISKDICDLFMQRYGIPVIQAYGIIEIGLPVINYVKSSEVPDAIGYAVPGYEVAIVNDEGKPVAAGITGHLAIRGPGMFEAYLNPPLLRDEVMKHGWFLTGDLASKSSDGLIRVEGRRKSMINVAGNKVFPEEVEIVLNRHPHVALSRVSGYMHQLLGECVMAEVVPDPNVKDPDGEVLRTFCRKHLSSFKVPQKIVFVASLPMTGSGKLKR